MDPRSSFSFLTAERIASTTFTASVDLSYSTGSRGTLTAPIVGVAGAAGAFSGDINFTQATPAFTAISPEADLAELDSVGLLAVTTQAVTYNNNGNALTSLLPAVGLGGAPYTGNLVLAATGAPIIPITSNLTTFDVSWTHDGGLDGLVGPVPDDGPGGVYIGGCTVAALPAIVGAGPIDEPSFFITFSFTSGGLPVTETFVTTGAPGIISSGGVGGTGTIDPITGVIAVTTGQVADVVAPGSVTVSACVFRQVVTENFGVAVPGAAVDVMAGSAGSAAILDLTTGIAAITTFLNVTTAAVTGSNVVFNQNVTDIEAIALGWGNSVAAAVPAISFATPGIFSVINSGGVIRAGLFQDGAVAGTLVDGGAVTNYSLVYRLSAGVGLEGTATLQVALLTCTLESANNLTVPLLIEDDGLGSLQVASTSDPLCQFTLDVNGINTIAYDSQTLSCMFSLIADPAAGPIVLGANNFTCNYFAQPVASALTSLMGGGLDGAATTRSQISAPALSASSEGLYALNKVEDLLQVVIPGL